MRTGISPAGPGILRSSTSAIFTSGRGSCIWSKKMRACATGSSWSCGPGFAASWSSTSFSPGSRGMRPPRWRTRVRRDTLPRMHYLSVEEGRGRPGLRLVLTRGVPGPWGELAKAILHVKALPYAAVAQEAGGDDAVLVSWTGAANAPTAVWNDEPARRDRNGILFLAERLAPEPPLLPLDARERALALGLCDAIAGESGFGWCRRLMMVERMMRAPSLPEPARQLRDRLAWRYGWSEEAAAGAPARCAEVLGLLAARLRTQGARGSRYLVGDALGIADLTWATFAVLVRPLAPEVCPMPAQTRAMYEMKHPVVDAALDPALLAHRDFVYERHLALPLDF